MKRGSLLRWCGAFGLLLLICGNNPTARLVHAQQIISPSPGTIPSGRAEAIPNQIVVRFRKDPPESVIQSLHAAHGARTLKIHPRSRLRRLEFPPGANLNQILAAYRRHPLVEEAGLNLTVHAFTVPNDPNYSFQWHLHNTTGGMWAEEAWDLSAAKGQGIVVAVIDTGVAYANVPPFTQAPDLKNKSFVAPWDFFNNDPYPNDDNGHGTHVAGTIAQDTATPPPYGVAGVAYHSLLMPLKVLNYDGSGAADDLIEAITYAVDNGADVINMSLGFPNSGSPDANGQACTEIVGLNAALQHAHDQGVVVVAASGNDGGVVVSCPAASPTVIAVGATRFDGQVTFYSNKGSALDITAPGGDPNVDQNNDGFGDGVLQETFCYDAETLWLYYNLFGLSLYDEFCDVFYAGTSMATPHVVGTAALLLSENPALSPDQVRCYLESTARDRGSSGWDSSYGWGALDARAAVALLLTQGLCTSPPPPPPGSGVPPTITGFTPTIGSPGTSVTITGTEFESDPILNVVRFNTSLAAVSSATATAISTNVPSGAASGRISVSTRSGQGVSSADFFVPASPYTGADVEFTNRMAIGETKTVTLSTANKIGLVIFDGVAGQRLGLGVTNVTFPSGDIVIIGPNGTTLLSKTTLTSSGRDINVPVLPLTGTYTIQVHPASPNTGSVTLILSEDLTGSIAINGSVTVNIPTIGQRAWITFTGSAGQRLGLGITNVSYANGDISILKPDGSTLLATTAFTASGRDVNVPKLPTTGTYTIVVNPQYLNTGSIKLTLSEDLTGSITINGSPATVTTSFVGQRAWITFSGKTGQRLGLGITDVKYANGDIYILKPDGITLLGQTNFTASGREVNVPKLPIDGIYTIQVNPWYPYTGSVTLTLSEDLTGSITINGSPATVTTSFVGQRAWITFSGKTGQRLGLGITDVKYANGDIYILKPDGTTLLGQTNFTASGAGITVPVLPSDGIYTIQVNPWYPYTGSTTLILSEDLTGTLTINDPSVSVNITRPGQNARLTFSGAANQQVTVRLTNNVMGSTTVKLLKPDNSTLKSATSSSASFNFASQILPANDTYTVLVDPSSIKIGSIEVKVTSP